MDRGHSRKAEGKDCYKVESARDAEAFPEPNWPSQSLGVIIINAFAGRYIDRDDHPALLRLVGAKQTPVVSNFDTVVVADFEYEVSDGELPNVLCMVAYVLDGGFRHVRTIRSGAENSAARRRSTSDRMQSSSPIPPGPKSHASCNWVGNFPTHIYDLHTSYLAASNILLP